MDEGLKVFKSLNCPLCGRAFSNLISLHSGSPWQLICGCVICQKCWDKEKSFARKDQQHRCEYIGVRNNMVSSLLDLLNHPSIIMSPNGNGYILSQEFKISKCSNCHLEYSVEVDERKPFELACDHTICRDCFLKLGKPKRVLPFSIFDLKCPFCENFCEYRGKSRPTKLEEFLRELPEMIAQIPKVRLELILNRYRKIFSELDEELEENLAKFEELTLRLVNSKKKNGEEQRIDEPD